MIKLSADQENKLLAQVRSAKNNCELVIEDDQLRYQDSWLYFRKLRPANIEPNKKVLDYVEPILQNCVNVLTPQILDIFTENDEQAVAFRNKGFNPNPMLDSLINNRLNHIVLNENDGYKLLENAIKDALISGDSFIKIYMEETVQKEKLKLSAFTAIDDIQAELDKDNWKIDLPEDFPNGKKGNLKSLQWRTRTTAGGFAPDGTPIEPQPVLEIMGSVPIYKLDKKLKIKNVGMQDLIFDITCGEEWDQLRYLCHKNTITVGQGMAMGYPREKLEASSTYNRLGEASYSKVNLVTGNQINTEDYTQLDMIDPLERKITLDEHFIYSSIPDNETQSKLYQVITTDSEILDVREAGCIPFVHMQMEIIPDSFFGASLYDRCKMYQDVLSTMVRLGIKQNIKAVYNKHLAFKGMYDRAALESDDTNAIIEIDQIGAVAPYVPPQLDQSYATILEFMNSSAQNTIGATVGNMTTEEGIPMNTAAATVAMILANEGLKSKVVAKTIARTGIAPLYKIIYEVCKQEGLIVRIPQQGQDGSTQFQEISASDWPDIYDFVVDINTQRDVVAENDQIIGVVKEIAALSQIPLFANQTQYLFNVANKLGQQVGVDMTPFVPNPSAQPPDPQQAALQQKLQEMEIQFKQFTIEEQEQKVNKLVAEINKLEAEVEEKLRDGVATRETKYDTALNNIKKTVSDANDKDTKNQINAKAVSAEIELNTAKHINETRSLAQDMRHKEVQHQIDITIPQVPKPVRGVPNGVRQ